MLKWNAVGLDACRLLEMIDKTGKDRKIRVKIRCI